MISAGRDTADDADASAGPQDLPEDRREAHLAEPQEVGIEADEGAER